MTISPEDLADGNPKQPWSWAHLVAGIIVVLILIYFRPWIQPFILALYRNPFVIQAVVLGAAAAGIAYWHAGRYDVASTTFTTVAAAFILVGGFLNAPYQGVTMADDVQNRASSVDSLPNMSAEHPRILPRTVAREYAQNSLQEPRHRLAEGDIAIGRDGTPQWSYPLRPDGGLNTFIVDQKGASFVDMTTESADITMNTSEMNVGIGTQITDNIFWSLRKQQYLVNYQDPFVFESNDGLQIATPIIDYDFHFRFPIIYTTPTWGGVALTDETGSTTYVNADDVPAHDVLNEQRTYPFDLARAYVSSMEYRRGIINKWFFHEDQLEVAPVPGLGNDQPFMMLTEDNPSLFVATEPYGDASGLFEIWTVDAVTGEYSQYRLDQSQGLIGANKAVNFVRQANSRVSWADTGSSTGFTPIEPLPVVVDDELYWQIRVVPVDSAGVAFTSFVNARTSDVITAETDDEIRAFLRGDDVNASDQPANTTGSEQDGAGTVTVTIIEDGSVVSETAVNRSSYEITVE
jgi:hypothetical protein